MVEKHYKQNILCLRSDGGGEVISKKFDAFLQEHGIKWKVTCSYSPQQNGVAKQKNRHIAECARVILNEKAMPKYYWAESVFIAVYLMNRSPTIAIHKKIPFEALNSEKPDHTSLRVFECICFVHVPDEKRNKLDPKAWK